MPPDSHRALIGLGSNLGGPLGGPETYIETALKRLAGMNDIASVKRSHLYRSAPWGNTEQDDFLNAVAEISCHCSAHQLLKVLLDLENDLGRRRNEKWGPRVIDMDLLCFDELQLQSDSLILPHPRMHERAFVLVPLLQLDPEFEIPGRGRAQDCLAMLGDDQSVRLA